MTALPPDDLDIAEMDARMLWRTAWKVAHLSDSLWKVARIDALAAAKLILERDQENSK